MATIRPFDMFDCLKFNQCNLDLLTETFYTHFYGKYLNLWPEYCATNEDSCSNIQAYLLGKVEGEKNNDQVKTWHGHVSCVTVAPQYRRQGLARALMDYLEEVTIKTHDAWFVDLFVRPSNKVAVGMYKALGYIVYRTVESYYTGEEDAYDMRKAMPRDLDKATLNAKKTHIKPWELDFN